MREAYREVILRRSTAWFRIDWAELWAYRDLLYLLVRRDFLSQYRQTLLGPAWSVVQPLVTTLVFTVVFGKFAGVPTEGVPPVLFYLCGVAVWSYFSRTFSTTASVLQVNAKLFGKIYFPRLIMPVATCIGGVIPFVIQFGTFAVALFWYWSRGGVALPGLGAFGAVLWLLQISFAGLGAGLLFAGLTAKYRDLSHALSFVAQVWMYATPVIYPLSVVSKRWLWVYQINPLSAPVEGFRHLFLGTPMPTLAAVGVSVCSTAALFLLGLGVFGRVERSYIDTV